MQACQSTSDQLVPQQGHLYHNSIIPSNPKAAYLSLGGEPERDGAF